MRRVVIGAVGILLTTGAILRADDARPADAPPDNSAQVRDWRYVLTIHEIAKADDAERLGKLMADNPDRALARLPNGQTPAHCAAEAGALKSLRLLGKAGADMNVVDNQQRTPLALAIGAHYVNTVKTLLELGADATKDAVVDGQPPEPPLTIAARRGDTEIMKLLLEAKADVSARSADGRTALVIAAANRNRGAILLLLEHGAEPNVKDSTRSTPLIYAAGADDQVSVAALLAHGANVKMANRKGQTALTLSESPAIWRMLVDKGADTNIMIGDATRLQHYIATGNLELVKAWLQYRPDPFVVDRHGRTAKELARKYAIEATDDDDFKDDRQAIVPIVESYQKQYAAEEFQRENATARTK